MYDQILAVPVTSPLLRGVDAGQHAHAAAVRRVLADRHVDAVLVEDRRADDLAEADERAVVVVAAVLANVAVEINHLLAR